jgi:acetyltransferase-like isoleucine patch superfamily enzyme
VYILRLPLVNGSENLFCAFQSLYSVWSLDLVFADSFGYLMGGGMIRELVYTAHAVIYWFLQSLPERVWANRLRGFVWKPLLKGAGVNLQIARHVEILSPSGIVLGDNVFLGRGCWLNGYGGLTVGDGVLVGPNVCIATANHTVGKDGGYRWGEHRLKQVSIGTGVWLAANVCVLPGCTINDGVVVGAGSVVGGVLTTNGVYAGSLAVIRRVR